MAGRSASATMASAAPFFEPRAAVGSVHVSVDCQVIQSLHVFSKLKGLFPVATYSLPDGIDGKIGIYLRGNVNGFAFFIVDVEGLSEDSDVFFSAQFKWVPREEGWPGPSVFGMAPAQSYSNHWLRGSGRLATFAHNCTIEFWGDVTVYGPPAAPEARVDFRSLRSLTALSDVVLRAAGSEFPAHRTVLAARSPVFLTMFTGQFKESTTKVVDVEVDCSAEVFGVFVDSLYSGALAKRSCADLLQLLELAERYLVGELKQQCVRQLLEVGPGEAVLVFEASIEQPFIPKQVGRHAGDVIKRNWETISTSDAWTTFVAAQPAAAAALEFVL